MDAAAAGVAARMERVFGGDRRRVLAALVPDASPGIVCELVLAACTSAGGPPAAASSAAAALHAAFLSISLVDGILDGDPYQDLSHGRTANVAIALQAAAYLFLGDLAPDMQAAVGARISDMLIDTACGQERDVTAASASGAEAWSVTDAKTAPLFEAALFCGALLGGADGDLARRIEGFGRYVGRLIQIQDDLTDVLEPGSDADWRRPNANLILTFAARVDHPMRSRVVELFGEAAHEGPARDEIRRILADCGAVSYCLSNVLVLADQARRYLETLPIDATPLDDVVTALSRPVHTALRTAGTDAALLAKRLNGRRTSS